ncbi:Sensor histidine kinase YehU [Amantichitinum ursilacus]|uniref:histidine kinase n=1 Tax=Amantichitinum ursilacus TaxID=857265 RepID=A0A0N0GM06_9NEIS|nr:Sensor histidine kinase YehU [Amantichitinum ursilacus]
MPSLLSARAARLPGLAGAFKRPAFLFWLFVLNSLVGLCFWAGLSKGPLWPDLLVANCIGFSVYGLVVLLRRFTRIPNWLRVVVAGPLGVIIGFELAALLVGSPSPWLRDPSAWLHALPSFLIAGVTCAFLSVLLQSSQMKAALETERRQAAELRQSETAAKLAMLQAQIEPHFLFNTLANVQSLISREPEQASRMLDHLNRYLRASLGRTRKAQTLLQEELELVEALLQIAAIRLGERLAYRIDVPADLRALPLPPLLLQPLVENAVSHGIEPAIHGGEIVISARVQQGQLTLQVCDSGAGLGGSGRAGGGVGLSNVRSRLHTLYGERARLQVSANAGPGVTASLVLPLEGV